MELFPSPCDPADWSKARDKGPICTSRDAYRPAHVIWVLSRSPEPPDCSVDEKWIERKTVAPHRRVIIDVLSSSHGWCQHRQALEGRRDQPVAFGPRTISSIIDNR